MEPPKPIFPAHSRIVEPDLLFHPDRDEDRSPHPLLGLTQFGPYSRSTVNNVLDPIRVAVIAPHAGLRAVDKLFVEFKRRQLPKERRNYLPEYLGFSALFGVNIVRSEAVFEFPRQFDDKIQNSANSNVLLAGELARALTILEKRNEISLTLLRSIFRTDGIVDSLDRKVMTLICTITSRQ